MIEIKDKAECCGCAACANICPQNAIVMKKDEEGFLYPFIDREKCINCQLCEGVCPEKNLVKESKFNQSGYLIQIKDEKIRNESTAGGAFTAIADYVLENGGVVFGAAYDKNFKVRHKLIEHKENLNEFRNSKYVQSEIGNTYKDAKSFLEDNKMVCFSGTPCQIEGLKSYLKKEYKKLITVDAVCHAVPSPLIWDKYIKIVKNKYGNNIRNILFRSKHYGYSYPTMNVKNIHNINIYNKGIESDYMLRAFFSNICDRPSCYQCKFKKRYRVSDFTIWDCFDVYKFDKKMNDNKGTTRMLIHSEKGRYIFNQMKEKVLWKEVSADKLVTGVYELVNSVDRNNKRDEFMRDAENMEAVELFEKYFPETFKVKINHYTRVFLCETGIYKFIKEMYIHIKSRESKSI